MALPFLFGNLRFDQHRHGWAINVGFLLGNWMVRYAEDNWSPTNLPQVPALVRKAKFAIEGLLQEHNITLGLPEYDDRENPAYASPDTRARTSQYAIVKRVQECWSTEHAAFVLIGQAGAFFEWTPDITPQDANGLQERARQAILQLQVFCRNHFQDGKIPYDGILASLRKTNGQYSDIVDLLFDAQKPVVILLILANPVYHTQPNPQQNPNDVIIISHTQLLQEQQTLKDVLRAGANSDKFELHTLSDAQPDNLQLTITRIKPTIIHFSGHGNANGIFVSDAHGVATPVNTTSLQEIFATASHDNLQGIVMNSCYTAEAYRSGFSNQQAVLMHGEVSSPIAIRFTKQFYTYLGEGLSFEDSCNRAKVDIGSTGNQNLRAEYVPRST